MEPINFLFNAEYDFELRSNDVPMKLKLATESMAPLFMPAFDSEDIILSPIEVDNSFNDYLATVGLPSAKIGSLKEKGIGKKGQAWGWSDQAIEKLHSAGYETISPSPQVCRSVNSREFSFSLVEKYQFGAPNSAKVSSVEELQNHIKSNNISSFVLKPLFGNAGAGFLFSSQEAFQTDLPKIEKLLNAETVIVEPWCERIADFASLFSVTAQGKVTIHGHHQNICNRIGSFFGTRICESDELLQSHKATLEAMIEKVAQELSEWGYFGMVSIDSFLFKSDTGEELALAIDVNCRFTMSWIAHRVKKKMQTPSLFYRFFARKRHKLPETYELLQELLGEIAYSNVTKKGVVLLSPLRIRGSDNVVRQPQRTAFAIVGDNSEEVMVIDTLLRQKFK